MSLEMNGLDALGGPSPTPHRPRVIATRGGVPGEWVLKFPTSVRPGVVFLDPPPAGGVRFDIVPLDRPQFATRMGLTSPVVLQRITAGPRIEALAEFANPEEAEAALTELVEALRNPPPSAPAHRPAGASTPKSRRFIRHVVAAFVVAMMGMTGWAAFVASQRFTDTPPVSTVETGGVSEWNPLPATTGPDPAPVAVGPSQALPSAWDRAGASSATTATPIAVEEVVSPRPAPSIPDPNPGAVLSPEASSVIAALAPPSPPSGLPPETQATVDQAGQVGSWAVEERVPLPGHITANAQAPGDVFIQSLMAPSIGYAELAKLAPPAGELPASTGALVPITPPTPSPPPSASNADAFMDAVRKSGQQP